MDRKELQEEIACLIMGRVSYSTEKCYELADLILELIPDTLDCEEIVEILTNYKTCKEESLIEVFTNSGCDKAIGEIYDLAQALAGKIAKPEPSKEWCECPPCNEKGSCSTNGICWHCGKLIKPKEETKLQKKLKPLILTFTATQSEQALDFRMIENKINELITNYNQLKGG